MNTAGLLFPRGVMCEGIIREEIDSETGLMAKITYIILRNAGFKTRFLNNNVVIIKNRMYCAYR